MTCRTTWLMEGGERGLLQRGRHAVLAGRSAAGAGYIHRPLAPGRSRRPAGGRQQRRRRSGWHRPLRERSAGTPVSWAPLECGCRTERVFGFRPKAQGAGFALERFDFLRASRHRIPTTSGTGSIRIVASGFARATSRWGRTAPFTWLTGSIRSSAVIRCRIAGLRPDLSHHAERANPDDAVD